MATRGTSARNVSHQSNSGVKSDRKTASSVSIDSEESTIDNTAHVRGPQLQCMGTPSKLPTRARGLQGQYTITPSNLSMHLLCAHEQYADGTPSKLPSHIRDDDHTSSRAGKSKQPNRRFSVPAIILSLTIAVYFIGVFLSHHSINDHLSDESHSPGFLSDFQLSQTLISGMNEISHKKDTMSSQRITVADMLVEEKTSRMSNQTESWEQSSKLPQWMKDYVAWHTEQLKGMNENNWESFQYLILRCSEKDGKCGGVADRLKPIPLILLMAARTNRIFMIRWTKPCRIEEFLVPNEGGINWSVPTWMEEKLQQRYRRSFYARKKETMMERLKVDVNVIAETRIQDVHGGAEIYNAIVATNITESSRAKDVIQDDYDEIYHDLFRAVFRPVAPIQNLINKKLESTGLLPGEFSVAQYRAFYAVEHEKEKVSEELLIDRAINSVNCASELRPGGPVYFASDSKVAVEAVQKYASQTNRSIVSLDGPEALHLDKENDRPPSDFYPVFVDLYLMGSGRCVSFGQGGFGRYALLLGYDATCFNRHFYKGNTRRCDWTDVL